MEISASFSFGRVAYHHDVREGALPKNVDPSLTHSNVVLIDNLHGRTVEEYTNEKFQPVIDAYNKGKKPCLQIKSTYSEWHFTKGKSKCPLVYEAVAQLGDHPTLGHIWYENTGSNGLKQFYISQYKDVVEHFKETYPYLEILWATVHMDEPEGTPHLHIAFQPVGDAYKQGLKRQVSIGNALSCDGIERLEKRKDAEKEGYQLTRLYKAMEDYMKDKVMSKNIEKLIGEELTLKERVSGRKHDDVQRYAYKAQKANEEVKKETESLKEEKEALVSDLNNIREELTQKALERDEVEENTLKAQKALIEAENALSAKKEELNALDKLKESLESMISDTINRFYKALGAIDKALDRFCKNKKLSEEELQRYDKATSKQISYTEKGKSLIYKSLEAYKDKDTSTVIDTNNALNTLIDDMEEDEDLDL